TSGADHRNAHVVSWRERTTHPRRTVEPDARSRGGNRPIINELSAEPRQMSSRCGSALARDRAPMSIATLSAYILSAMIAWMPLKVHHREAEDEARARYQAIAQDIAAVALDENEPPLFAGEDGRTQTALLVASIASFESHFRADVDAGKARGDNGISWCVMQ